MLLRSVFFCESFVEQFHCTLYRHRVLVVEMPDWVSHFSPLTSFYFESEYTESGLKLLGLDLASLATQGVGAGAQPNAYTGYGIF